MILWKLSNWFSKKWYKALKKGQKRATIYFKLAESIGNYYHRHK